MVHHDSVLAHALHAVTASMQTAYTEADVLSKNRAKLAVAMKFDAQSLDLATGPTDGHGGGDRAPDVAMEPQHFMDNPLTSAAVQGAVGGT